MQVKAIEKEVLIHMRDYQEIGKQLEIIREIFICEDSALMPMKRDLLKFLVARIPLDEIEVPDLQLILEDSLKNSNTEQILPNVKNMTGKSQFDLPFFCFHFSFHPTSLILIE